MIGWPLPMAISRETPGFTETVVGWGSLYHYILVTKSPLLLHSAEGEFHHQHYMFVYLVYLCLPSYDYSSHALLKGDHYYNEIRSGFNSDETRKISGESRARTDNLCITCTLFY
eukprot:sb/3476845/